MGIRMNRQIVHGNIKYNMFCDSPCWDISRYGNAYLLSVGFHPHDHPFVKDEWEQYLLQRGYLKCISIPTSESQYDQLNLEVLHMSILS
jgi:hypothetical protein